MSIVVQCPHCETKFNLQPDMVGKSMRCPNLDCRQVFTVKPQPKEIEPPLPTPEPIPSPLPLPPDPARATKAKPRKADKPRPATAKPAVIDAEIVEAAIIAPPKVKEVVWSEGTDLPPPTGKKPVRPEVLDDTGDQPIYRRKKKKSRGPIILIGMVGRFVRDGRGHWSLPVAIQREGRAKPRTAGGRGIQEGRQRGRGEDLREARRGVSEQR